ncbi:addiction module antidote protein [Phenylobacterium sp.]|uniref:addiction module antidote protein n=1 Tax=Phenylobacterium sp. TaxID=1871053 RepID=UPI002FC7E2D7
MNTIFIGGSRHVSRLPVEVKKRLDNVVASGHRVIVGDANGADKAVQKHLVDTHYDKVTVFCTGDKPRNNLGTWQTHHVDAPKSAKGFHFYAAKDREMAREADFGLMIWDGKSPGTVLNVLRLAIAGKIAVLFNVPDKDVINIKTVDQWKTFIARCNRDLQKDIADRATPEEWRLAVGADQPSLLAALEPTADPPSDAAASESRVASSTKAPSPEEMLTVLNKALAEGDATTIMDSLGVAAREHGMSQISRDTGLSRESLYRSLDANGNPEFATVLKVLSSIGLHLQVCPGGLRSEHPRVSSDA